MESTQRIEQMRRLVEKNGISTEVSVSLGLRVCFFLWVWNAFYSYVIFVFAEVW